MTTMAATRQRRKDVERLMMMGWMYEVIADELGVPVTTVRSDSREILNSHGVKTRFELAIAAFKAGQKVLGER